MVYVIGLGKDEMLSLLDWAEIADFATGLTPAERRLKGMLRETLLPESLNISPLSRE